MMSLWLSEVRTDYVNWIKVVQDSVHW